MAEIIRMPKMSDTMTEGVIANWLKQIGDEIQSGDILAEVETDKATMELESYEDGTLLYIAIEDKGSVPVDGVIAIIGEAGENIESLLKNLDSNSSTEESPTPKNTNEPTATTADVIDTTGIEATVIRMPKMSDTMTDGTIAAWHKQVGDEVVSGDILAEVETDKATMELESYDDGQLLYIGVEAGNSIAVDGIIAIIGAASADYETLLKAENQKDLGVSTTSTTPEAEQKITTETASSSPSQATTISSTSSDRILASPLAKKIAQDKGFDLGQINGSGENGRIIKRDVENFVPTATSTPASSPVAADTTKTTSGTTINLPQLVGEESFEEIPVSQMRKVIASRLSESKHTAPHFYVSMAINMDKAMEARKSLNEISPVKISFNDLVVKATAMALKQHPGANSSWLGDKVRVNKHVSIGVAMAIPDGLVVPVVRFTDTKSLSHISAEIKNFGVKAKSKKITPDDMTGNTFTISNLGMFGVEDFTAIINTPDACILAVGGIHQKPIVKEGQIVPGNIMKVTLSSDHRAVDGAVAAAFLNTLKDYLEDPIKLLV